MFFILSKLIWFFIHPSSIILVILMAGAVQLWRGRRRSGAWLTSLGMLSYAVFGLTPVSNMLLTPIENRFPRPELPQGFAPGGIIVLGGAVDPGMDSLRPASALNEAGERMTETFSLSRRFPQARIVFTGGTGTLVHGDATEADAAAHFFTRMGLDPARIVYENRSRNTAENARFTRDLVLPQPGQKWLLVTSAFHMPRSMELFRRAGFDVLPWPVDYRARKPLHLTGFFVSPAEGLRRTDLAAKEWLGLLVYRLTGRTGSVFPAP